MKKQVYKSPRLKGMVERRLQVYQKRKQIKLRGFKPLYFDAETVRLAVEKRAASRDKRLADKLRLAKMARNPGGEVI